MAAARYAAERGQRFAVALRWRPEWRIATTVAAAWLLLLAGAGMGQMKGVGGYVMQLCAPGRPQYATLSSFATRLGEPSGYSPASVFGQLPGWSLMVLAMMVPVTLPAVRHVGLNSMRYRRRRAMALYTAVYVAVWGLFGLFALALVGLLRGDFGVNERTLLSLLVAVAAAWQLTRAKRRALLACGRAVPLYPTGWRANLSCARFGLVQSRRCVVSCWAIMLAMAAVSTDTLVWMLGLTGIVASEELTRVGRHHSRYASAVLALAAIGIAWGL